MNLSFIKRDSVFIFSLFLLLFLLTTVKYPHIINTQYFQDRWYPCLDRFASGTLYEQDYHCSQGPVLLASLYLIQQTGNSLYSVAFFTGILLSAFLFLLLRKTIFWETSKKPTWFFLFIFCLLLYYPFFTTWFDMLLSTFLLISGLYILYHTSYRFKEIIALFFLLAASLTKITSIPPAAAILLHYLYTTYHTDFHVLKKKLLHFTLFSLCTIAALLFTWPKLPYYYLIAHFYNPNQNAASSGYSIISGLFQVVDIYYTICMFLAFCMLFLFLKRRDVYSFAALFAAFPIAFLWNQASGSQTTLIYYFTPFLTLALLGGYCFYFHETKRTVRITTVLIVLLLLTPFLLQTYYGMSLKSTRVIITNAGMDFLSQEVDSILIEEKPNPLSVKTLFPALRLEGKEITTVIPALTFWDYFYSPKLVALGVFSESNLTQNATYYTDHIDAGQFDFYLQKILQKEFDVIITQDNGFLNTKDLLNAAVTLNANSYKCRVYIPYLYYNIDLLSGSHSVVFFFKDTELCYNFAKEIYEYYQNHFQSICSVSGELAEQVREILRKNAMELPSCKEEGTLRLERYDYFTILSVYP